MNNKDKIFEILEKYPEYRENLFKRGYLITTAKLNCLSSYPFYGFWNSASLGRLKDGSEVNIYCHKLQGCNLQKDNVITAAIIGHAYNPFDMKYKEKDILADCISAFKKSREDFFDKISELTGIHLIILNDRGKLVVVQDCAGMKSCYYGIADNKIYITSHVQLVGDICSLSVDSYVKEFTGRWFFKFGKKYLPGNISPYKELKILGPNKCLEFNKSFQVERFFPVKPHEELNSEQYDRVLENIKDLLKNNIELCTMKWKSPAISLSGGTDSKTTLACANGFYDRLKFFSFHSKPSEVNDSKAAHEICNAVGLRHDIYPVQGESRQVKDYDVLKSIICHNIAYMGIPGENEIRKYILLYRLNDFDVELKSWISEIGRVMWERKYGSRLPNVFTPRHFTIFQTKCIFAPGLLRKSDGYFRKYLKEIGLETPLYNYEHADSYYWEFAFGIWGHLVVSGQDIFSHEVTMPMNNRKLIDMFLWFPHEFRKSDMVHREIIKRANKNIGALDISVHNPYLGGRRILLERLYYKYATLFIKKNEN